MEEKAIQILKTLGLISNIEEHQKIYNHAWRKHKSRIYWGLNSIEYLLILISTVTGSVSVSAFAYLVGFLTGITSSKRRRSMII